MKKRGVIASVVLAAIVAALVAAFFFPRSGSSVSGPVRHEVYVWQRAWTQSVRDAVALHGTNFAEIVPLKAEISWKDNKPQLTRVAVDYAALAATRRPVGVALRIGPFAGPFVRSSFDRTNGQRNDFKATEPANAADAALHTQGESVTDFICNTAASIVAEARSKYIELSELQIDFDCAESKLDGYRIWIEAIQHRVAPLPVTITALPSWLDSRAFLRLAGIATNYVLQVHSVARPKSFEAPFTLCDPRAARRAVRRAGRIGVPFRVALPTYGYMMAFDSTGTFLGLSAEGPRPNWPAKAQLREVSSNPIELSALVREWTASRPEAMRGVIWYRLPVIADKFNWSWRTLGAIVDARVPQERVRVAARRVEPGLVEISFANEGDRDIFSRLAVEVRWSNARLVAGDALRDFMLTETGVSVAVFQSKTNSIRLPAGDTRKIGWLRFDRDCEVQCALKEL